MNGGDPYDDGSDPDPWCTSPDPPEDAGWPLLAQSDVTDVTQDSEQ